MSDEWEVVDSVSDSVVGVCEASRHHTWTSELRFWLNGEEIAVTNPSPTWTLLDWMREQHGLTGTHVGCGEGGCGICTVALARMDPKTKEPKLVPINSCLRRLCALDGCHVVTTQGLGSQSTGFHAVQAAIADGNGVQCGFCTPGWVMNMYSLLEKNEKPAREEVEQHFDGNLCRCTGFRPILTAFGAFAEGGSQCGRHRSVAHPVAMLSHKSRPLHFVDRAAKVNWYRPVNLEQYVQLAVSGMKLQPICAKTSDGVRKYYGKEYAEEGAVFVDITLIPELQGVELHKKELHCGATVSIADLIEALEKHASASPSFTVVAEHLKRVAAVQIRSVASWAGNIMFNREFPEFQSDISTILAAAGTVFQVQCGLSTRHLTTKELIELQGDALLLSMKIPKLPAGCVFQTFKTSQRHVFAHAIVNLGAFIAFEQDGQTVQDARIVVAGATRTLLVAHETAAQLKGCKLIQAVLDKGLNTLRAEIAENPSPSQVNTPEYLSDLAASFLYKTFLAGQPSLTPQQRSALVPFIPADARPVSSGTESFGTAGSPVSQYIPKLTSKILASGEALFPSDFGVHSALFGQLVFSTSANAQLVALDVADALKLPGVRDFVGASAIPGLNCVNAPFGGENLAEKVFFEVGDVLPCVGAPLGIMVADTWKQARLAAKSVTQKYKPVGAVVASLDDAVRLRRSTLAVPAMGGVSSGGRRTGRREYVSEVNFGPGRKGAEREISNTFKTGAQYFFYMETQAACAFPADGDGWEVVVSDQDSNFTQQCLASIMGVPMHKINVKVPRAGGAYGGKLNRQMLTASAAVVAANKLRRPVRVQNERSDDMQMITGRQPMNFNYDVTFSNSGKVDSMTMNMVCDPGWFYGDLVGDMSMAVHWADNCYKYQTFKVKVNSAPTDTPHSTSMRAPGCMQSILAAEVAMEHVAKTLNEPLEVVQERNFYKEKDVTPFGDHIGQFGYNWTVPLLWSRIQIDTNYAQRKADVHAYNGANRWTKRGIALSPVKYVMDDSFYSSGATICIYSDGTVLVSSGGSEIGQGLNTKVACCVAETLDAPLDKVIVGPRETSKIPNNTGTGGSGTSECSAQAAIVAAQKLVPRLLPYRGEKSWEDVVSAAAAKDVPLLASGWWQASSTENANQYATQGAASCEVQIDVLTGELLVRRVDVLMDIGTQLDAAVDIGQLQGGFVQAMGYLTSEELKFGTDGTQLNAGTWDYKIPSAYDIPLVFNMSLLKDTPNPTGVKGSKATAEPAMCLLPSVYLAVKHAIYAARVEVGLGDAWFNLNVPLTTEAIRSAVSVPQSELLLPH